MAARLMLLVALSQLMWVSSALAQTPPAASSSLPALPPPPPPPAKPADGQEAPPPPPPAAAAATRHYQFPLGKVWAQGLYQDLQMPAGKISIKWVAVGAGQSDVSSNIEVTVQSPSLYVRTSPSGGSEMFIGPGPGNVRILARRTSGTGPFTAKIELDLTPVQ